MCFYRLHIIILNRILWFLLNRAKHYRKISSALVNLVFHVFLLMNSASNDGFLRT